MVDDFYINETVFISDTEDNQLTNGLKPLFAYSNNDRCYAEYVFLLHKDSNDLKALRENKAKWLVIGEEFKKRKDVTYRYNFKIDEVDFQKCNVKGVDDDYYMVIITIDF